MFGEFLTNPGKRRSGDAEHLGKCLFDHRFIFLAPFVPFYEKNGKFLPNRRECLKSQFIGQESGALPHVVKEVLEDFLIPAAEIKKGGTGYTEQLRNAPRSEGHRESRAGPEQHSRRHRLGGSQSLNDQVMTFFVFLCGLQYSGKDDDQIDIRFAPEEDDLARIVGGHTKRERFDIVRQAGLVCLGEEWTGEDAFQFIAGHRRFPPNMDEVYHMLQRLSGFQPRLMSNDLVGGTIVSTTKGNPTQGLIGATFGFFIGFAAVSLFGPTVGFLKAGAGVSAALAGLLISIPNLSGSLLRIPFSAMVDTTGGRKPFLILLGLSLVGVLGLAVIITVGGVDVGTLYPWLLVFGILGGCGSATFSVGISQTSYWFPQKRQGTALGVYAGVGNLAPGLFALLLTAVTLPLIGLGGSYFVWLALLAIGTVGYALLGQNAWYFQLRKSGLPTEEAKTIARDQYGQELFPKAKVSESLAHSAKAWQTWALVVVYFSTFGGFMALTGWLPKYWISYHGVTLALAGGLTALYSLTASLVRVAGGGLSDKIGGTRAAVLALVVTALGALIIGIAASLSLAIVGIVLMALGMGVGNAAVFKLVPQEIPDAIGGAAGWVGGLGAFGGFVIPNLMALFVTRSDSDVGYARGFLLFLVLAAVSLVMILLVKYRGRTAGAGKAIPS